MKKYTPQFGHTEIIRAQCIPRRLTVGEWWSLFISRPLWLLSPPTMKSFFMAIFKVAGRLLSNTFHLRAHAAFYITSTSTKSIRLPSHDEAVMSASFEWVNLTTCGSSAPWQWLRSRVPPRQHRHHPTWPRILTDSITAAHTVVREPGRLA